MRESTAARLLVLLPLLATSANAQWTSREPLEEIVEVTATRVPEDPRVLPYLLTVLDGAMLRARGATDLRSALGVAAGVDVAPGGDGGPASPVPEMWGLREFDAFLLVVDGVPWGGAFNPDLAALSLEDVARIEILRGAAPVMYGATSFVGVIHVIHAAPGAGEQRASASIGTNDTRGVAAAVDLPDWAGWSSRLSLDGRDAGYPDDRTSWSREHVSWRNERPTKEGRLRFDVDLHDVGQSPASPAPRVGTSLSPLVGADDNANPLHSLVDRRRLSFSFAQDGQAAFGGWAWTLAWAHASGSARRGFLEDVVEPLSPAHGFRQKTSFDEGYVDGHVNVTSVPKVDVVAGLDTMWGRASAKGGDFDYEIAPDGTGAPDGRAIASESDVRISDRRTFSGAYGLAAYTPAERWRIETGLRLNLTSESRSAKGVELATGATEGGSDSRSVSRLSGSAGVTFTAWSSGRDDVKVFTSFRSAYKPAAVELGVEPEDEILAPEDGESFELGARAAFLDRRLELELDAFRMDLSNVVIAEGGSGVPGLENGGEQRFEGVELEIRARPVDGLWIDASWCRHDARFRDFVQDFGGTPTQLAGKRLEMSPRVMYGVAAAWARETGFLGHVELRSIGDRFLNRRNTALAGSYTTVAAGVGWRQPRWEIRLDGENLGDARDPAAESELADAQYYRMESRRLLLTLTWRR